MGRLWGLSGWMVMLDGVENLRDDHAFDVVALEKVVESLAF